MHTARSALALFTWLLSACGSPSPDEVVDLTGLESIVIEPAGAELSVVGDTPAQQVYRAVGTFADGRVVDITASVEWSITRVEMGRFDGATLTTGTWIGGTTDVVARAVGPGVYATTPVTIHIERRFADPSADLPEGVEGLFGGPAAGAERAPRVIYPADGVMLPPNLGRFEVHFIPSEGDTLFELAFEGLHSEVRVFTRCTQPMNGGCVHELDPLVWSAVASSNRGTDVRLVVRGTDDAGTAVSSSVVRTLNITPEPLEGGIYYWTSSDVSPDDTAIVRFDFGAPAGSLPERVVSTDLTDGHCVGCHVVSPDGETLFTAAEGSYDAFVLLLDIATRAPIVPFAEPPRAAFASFAPDGSRYVGVFADENDDGFISYDLNVFDAATGAFIETIGVGGTESAPITHPDWSSDGERIVFTRVGRAANEANGTLVYSHRSSIAMVAREGNGWGVPVALTEAVTGRGTFYPTFSPEADLIAFNESLCPNGEEGDDCDTYDDPSATLFVMEPEPGADRVPLTRANAPSDMDTRSTVQNSFPKWAPFTFRRTTEFGSRLHWITFSSNRRYGLRDIPEGNTLVWMAAIDPDSALAGNDPSYPAFAFPFQDLGTDNHTAQWTQRVVLLE